jgi:hypothetical protein
MTSPAGKQPPPHPLDGAYLLWASSSLGLLVDPSIEVRIQGEDERGLYCKGGMQAQATLAVAPFSSLLTVECADSIPCIKTLRAQLREDDVLALLLVHELALGK